MPEPRVCVLGAGAWGTALAIQAARAGRQHRSRSGRATLRGRPPCHRRAERPPFAGGGAAAGASRSRRMRSGARRRRARRAGGAGAAPAGRSGVAAAGSPPLRHRSEGRGDGQPRAAARGSGRSAAPASPPRFSPGPISRMRSPPACPPPAVVASSTPACARMPRPCWAARLPPLRQRRSDRRAGRRGGEERDRDCRRGGDRRRPRRECPRRAGDARPGGDLPSGRRARWQGGDGGWPVRPRRPSADRDRARRAATPRSAWNLAAGGAGRRRCRTGSA